MTICSTCQGVMSQANHRLATDPGYLDDINRVLAEEGLTYHGTTTVKHFCVDSPGRHRGAKDPAVREETVDGVARGPVLWMLPPTAQCGAGI